MAKALIDNNKISAPISDELFQFFMGKIYTGKNESNYAIDYISNEQLIELIKVLTGAQLRYIKIHYVKNDSDFVIPLTIIIGKALDSNYNADDFYANLPSEYQLGIFV